MTFATTQWSLVLATHDGGDTGTRALAELCRRYRAPVLAYVRHVRRGHDAEDLTQAFFVHLLERGRVGAERERGRFRNWLLGALKHFLADALDADQAAKRGGGVPHVALDTDPGEQALQLADAGHAPDRVFERAFAFTLIDRAMAALRAEAEGRGKSEQLALLAEIVIEPRDSGALKALAASLGVRANTLAVAVSRYRARLQELVREEVAQTVGDPRLVDAEMRAFRETLRAP